MKEDIQIFCYCPAIGEKIIELLTLNTAIITQNIVMKMELINAIMMKDISVDYVNLVRIAKTS